MDKTQEPARLGVEEKLPGLVWSKEALGQIPPWMAVSFHDSHESGEFLRPRFGTFPAILTNGLIREEERVMDPRRPKRLTTLLHERVVTLPRCTRGRVGEAAVGVARLGLKLRMDNPRGRQPKQLGKNGVGTLAPAAVRCEVGLVGLLRGRSRRPWTDSNVPSPR
ncbi:hypothetical protein CRG98_012249 [Punica granatum]|uniref:Uncharacterized protein n=1 Tax=Punica granatum TaxID=22663 RepID=A0A2I0KFR7_PUNGR|nr:hypothetical protein CRG98_012249 [Punica granatum]